MEFELVCARGIYHKMTIDLVVAVYRERITWFERINPNVKIKAYAKFIRFDYDFEDYLDNIGRESQTYCHHIIKNYDNLADFTIFCQGNPFLHFKKEFDNPYIELFKGNEYYIDDFYPLDGFAICDQKGFPFSSWELNINEVWYELFEGTCPQNFIAIYGAQFIVSKELIRSRSREFWQKINDLHTKIEHLPWVIETMWYYIFDPRYKTKF